MVENLLFHGLHVWSIYSADGVARVWDLFVELIQGFLDFIVGLKLQYTIEYIHQLGRILNSAWL